MHSRLKEKAQSLRRQGKSISEITDALNASKSTVSYWCRDIRLSEAHIKKLAKRQLESGALGRLRAAELKRKQRIATTKEEMVRGRLDVGTLSQRDKFILGLGLYWGEGYKSGNEECGLTNSDPQIIVAFIEWVRDMYAVRSEDLILRVSLNATHRNRVALVEKYWRETTGISAAQFTKTSLIKAASKKKYENADNHFGTLRVKVRRGTNLRRRIIGSIDFLKTEFSSDRIEITP